MPALRSSSVTYTIKFAEIETYPKFTENYRITELLA
jgi:hypothetical protein